MRALPIPVDDVDTEYPTCPVCGQAWKVATRAATPHAAPIDPPTDDRPRYRLTGPVAPLAKHPDTGADRLSLSWLCGDHTLTVAIPALDLVPCLAGADRTACRGGQPLDPHKRWAQVHQCRCCNNRGTHFVRRDGTHPPACRSITAIYTTEEQP
jgi:hypothetical protein